LADLLGEGGEFTRATGRRGEPCTLKNKTGYPLVRRVREIHGGGLLAGIQGIIDRGLDKAEKLQKTSVPERIFTAKCKTSKKIGDKGLIIHVKRGEGNKAVDLVKGPLDT